MRSPFHRLPILFLAILPVVWGNCPYWFVGRPPTSVKAAASAKEGAAPRGESTCPCCRKKAAQPASPAPVDPLDCGDCPMLVARHGSAPAPTAVSVPTADAAGMFLAPVALPVAFDASLETASLCTAAGPPFGPPGSVVSRLLDEVSLRI